MLIAISINKLVLRVWFIFIQTSNLFGQQNNLKIMGNLTFNYRCNKSLTCQQNGVMLLRFVQKCFRQYYVIHKYMKVA